jgi:NAD(P)H-hydrate epimerase
VVIAGKGNNGGDGFVVARLLRRRGVRCDVILLAHADDVRGDAAENLRRFIRGRGRVIEAPGPAAVAAVREALARSRVVIDAIFGTGLAAPITGAMAEVVALINASGLPVFAIDMPSGIDSDTGQASGIAIEAEATATFGFPKIGQLLYPGAGHVGRLTVVDIGIPPAAVAVVAPRTRLLTAEETAGRIPARGADAHKGDTGHLLVVAGGRGKCGAAVLVADAAMRGGAGLVTIAVPESERPTVAARVREAMTAGLAADSAGTVDAAITAADIATLLVGKTAVAVGPGLGTGAGARGVVALLVRDCTVPLVLDADALNCIAERPASLQARAGPTVLTPHPGEMARLLAISVAEVQRDRLLAARRLAKDTGAHIVLKGARTVIASPDGDVAINPTGNPGMASGGMGDALTGVIGAFVAQGFAAADAAALGAYVHGQAGDLAVLARGGEIGIVASDVIAQLPRSIALTQTNMPRVSRIPSPTGAGGRVKATPAGRPRRARR